MSTVVAATFAANNFGDNLPQGQAGPLGLLVIVVLGVGCWFLYRSMSKHLRRLPGSFDPDRYDERGAWRPGTLRDDEEAGVRDAGPAGSAAGSVPDSRPVGEPRPVADARPVPDAARPRRSE